MSPSPTPQIAAMAPAAPVATAAVQACVPGQGNWTRTLQPRDYDGDGVPDAFHDTDLDITWLADAGASGLRTWEDANEWAAALRVGGRTGWRLPHAATDGGRIVAGTSELEHLHAVTLGNRGQATFNTALFRNLRQEKYLIGDAVQHIDGFPTPWLFDMSTGLHFFEADLELDPFHLRYAGWAVHDGDVTVPKPIRGQGTWEKTLQPRDYDGDGVPDAFYDTQLDITWLADAAASGPRIWADAMAWAASLRVGARTGWRLPTVQTGANCNPNPPPQECDPFIVNGTSELEHLYAVTLGNRSDRSFNPGPFRNVQIGDYFTDRTALFIASFQPAWYFDMRTGSHDVDGDGLPRNGWAVHAGDVGGP
jgi:hypothetical protein